MNKFFFILSMVLVFSNSAHSYTEFNEVCEFERKDTLEISIGPGLHCFEKKIVAGTLEKIENYTFEYVDPKLAKILGVEATKKGLIEYLEARVRYIVGNSAYKIEAIPEFIESSSSGIAFHAGQCWDSADREKKFDFFIPLNAECAGCAEYTRNAYFGLKSLVSIEGLFQKVLDSPNSEIIDLKPGFFYPTKLINQDVNDAEINQIKRISAYFHEARHHDHNESNEGFLHPVCPPEHPLSGFNACDYATDGPYTVGEMVFSALIKECKSCSKNDLRRAGLFSNEAQSRIISTDKFPSIRELERKNYQACLEKNLPNKKAVLDRYGKKSFETVIFDLIQKPEEALEKIVQLANEDDVYNLIIEELPSFGCQSQLMSPEQKDICENNKDLADLTQFLNDERFSSIESTCAEITRILPMEAD